jgi:Uma2 family endonuclease
MMAMATVTEPQTDLEGPEPGLMLRDVGWDDYESMLRIVGDRRIRVTYDAGTMEVRKPSQRHEQAVQLLGLFIPRLAEELEIAYEPLGTTTWKRRGLAKGIEPDQCYYIRNQAIVRERQAIDLDVDPPPDLAVEVDITHTSLDRMAIYAGLGVPEVWLFDGRVLTIYHLDAEGHYQPGGTSLSFPALRAADVERFVELGRTTDKLAWSRTLREWVREELIPRRGE